MKLSGPNPRPSFSLSLALASNPFTPPRDPHPLYPQFSTIIPCRSGHCQSKDPREGGPGKTCVCVHVCVSACGGTRVYVCIHTCTCVHILRDWIRVCVLKRQTSHTCAHACGCCKVGVSWGISSEGAALLQTI